MANVTVKGISPKQFGKNTVDKIGTIVNTELLRFESTVVKASPVGISGKLRQDWRVNRWDGKSASLVTSNQYYLFVELGRKPGSGISQSGQESVARWAKLKLKLSTQDARSFAKRLSKKYKLRGRKPQFILGLDKNLKPVPNQNLDKFFKNLDRRLK